MLRSKIDFPKIIAGFFIFLMVVTLLNNIIFFKNLFSSPVSPSDKISDNISSDSSLNSSGILISAIPSWHLFGQPPLKAENLSETRLSLELNGIMASSRQEEAYAIISTPGQDQKLYHIGHVLPGGAVLYQIDSKGVVIQYNGKLEQLRLARSETLTEKRGSW